MASGEGTPRRHNRSVAGGRVSDGSRILSVNTGSSSLKLTLYRVGGQSEVAELTVTAERIGTPGGRLRLAKVRGKLVGWEQIELPDHAVADTDSNANNGGVGSGMDSRVTVRVIPADENLMVARHTRRLISRKE